jgi:two-component system chemotaxis response regulator CheY
MINLDDSLLQEYLVETGEHLAAIETDLLALEKGGAQLDEELVNRALRAVHSVGGGAVLLELVKVRDLAHQLENALELIRARKMIPTPGRVRALIGASDRLHLLIQDPAASNAADIGESLAALARVCAEGGGATEGSRPDGGRLRILLVEDDFTSRLMLQTFLARYGECHVAVNGQEAVKAVESAFAKGQTYHLICSDIMMPEMDGREAVRRIRAMEEAQGIPPPSRAKIIMTTAIGDFKEVIRCFNELCDAYLVKPIDLAQLLGHMKSFQLVR